MTFKTYPSNRWSCFNEGSLTWLDSKVYKVYRVCSSVGGERLTQIIDSAGESN